MLVTGRSAAGVAFSARRALLFVRKMSLGVNPDLAKERASASFPVREMTYWLDGGAERTHNKERVRKLVLDDPVFSKKDLANNDRVQSYTRALEKINRIQQVKQEKGLAEDDLRLFKLYVGDTLPVRLTSSFFRVF